MCFVLAHPPGACNSRRFLAANDALERLYRETVGATKERMLREMVDALGSLASTAPVVFHFEDLHWADPSTIDLLRRLCQDTGKQRLLVTGTFRPEDVERGNHPVQESSCWRCRRIGNVRRLRSGCLPGNTSQPIWTPASLLIDSSRNWPL